MLASGMVVIFIEFPVMHWHFNPVLNASVLTAQAAMRVYMFHSCQFRAPVMSRFFHLHEPFEDITMDDVRPPFHPLRYRTDGDFDSDTRLTPTVSVDSDPSELSYLSYHVETDLSEPSFPSMIRLSSDSSSSSAAPRYTPPPVCGREFIRTRAIPRGRGRARGGGRGDATPGGFGNDFLPPDE